MDDLRRALGHRIRDLRETLGFSQAELARRAGLTPAYIGQIERGQRDPSFTVAAKIAGSLETTLDYLAYGAPCAEEELLAAWRALPAAAQPSALRVLRALADPTPELLAADD